MKRTPPILLSLILVISMLSACSAGPKFDTFSDEQRNEAYAYLLEGLNQAVPYYADYQTKLEGSSLNQAVQIQNEPLVLDAYASMTIPFSLDKASLASLRMIYQVASDTLLSPILSVELNGKTPFVEALSIDVALNWLSDTSKFPLDSYQDESLPAQIVDTRPQTLDFYDILHSTATPLQFSFVAGENTIKLTNVSSTPMTIREL